MEEIKTTMEFDEWWFEVGCKLALPYIKDYARYAWVAGANGANVKAQSELDIANKRSEHAEKNNNDWRNDVMKALTSDGDWRWSGRSYDELIGQIARLAKLPGEIDKVSNEELKERRRAETLRGVLSMVRHEIISLGAEEDNAVIAELDAALDATQ